MCNLGTSLPRDYSAGVAQLVEQLICNQLVGGSIPLASSDGIAGVTQLARVTAFQAVGRGFESRLPL